jgi:hypothetical protein
LAFQGIDALHQQEHGAGDEQKIDCGLEEFAVGDHHRLAGLDLLMTPVIAVPGLSLPGGA